MSNATHHTSSGVRTEPNGDEHERSVEPETILSMLGDDYARSIMTTIGAEPLSAREIAERLDLSRATVYRRLNRLEEAGIVRASLSYDPNGHHRKRFRVACDRLVLCIENDSIDVEPAA